MTNTRNYTVQDFAEFSRTTRGALLHYDKIDLLSPAARGENNYRYYTVHQLALVNVIRTLQNLGVSLEEIKDIKDNLTPSCMDGIFTQQTERIDEKIDGWIRSQKLLFTLRKIINSVAGVDESKISIKFLPAEAIILGDLNDYSRGKNDYDALVAFYHNISARYPDLDLNYPVWGFFPEDRVKRGDFRWPDRYYFYNPEGRDRRPAGLYAIAYARGGYGQCGDMYRRLAGYIERRGYEICGDAYEEYPLNEISIVDNNNYLIRAMISVRKK